jgi:hypothetical protein
MMPVPAIAGQTGRLDTEHSANLAGADFGDQAVESRTVHLSGARAAEIFVDDRDSLESEAPGVIG